jgi:hypothetical protein
MVRGVFAGVVLAVSVSMSLSACGSAAEPPSDVDLFYEYARSGDVINDPYPGGSGEDRVANFASMGSPEALQSSLLAAKECADDCHPGGETRAAAKDFGGSLHERLILVKHADGRLELVPLYVAEKSKTDALLIDAEGQTYADLADFRDNNDVLTSEDLVMLPEKITAVPGEGRIVTVYGRTATDPLPWVLGGGAAIVLLVGALALRRRAAARRTSG